MLGMLAVMIISGSKGQHHHPHKAYTAQLETQNQTSKQGR